MQEINGRYRFQIPCPDDIVGCGVCHYGMMDIDAYNAIHDCYFDIHNHTPENHIIYKLYKNIPNNIKNEAISWGWCDTVVRDYVYEWLGEK